MKWVVAVGQQALVSGPLMATRDRVLHFATTQQGLVVTFPFLTFSLKISPASNLAAAKYTWIISCPHQRRKATKHTRRPSGTLFWCGFIMLKSLAQTIMVGDFFSTCLKKLSKKTWLNQQTKAEDNRQTKENQAPGACSVWANKANQRAGGAYVPHSEHQVLTTNQGWK